VSVEVSQDDARPGSEETRVEARLQRWRRWVVDVDDGHLALQSVDGDGYGFRVVGGVGDGVGHAGLHERCYSSSLGSSGAVMADAGVTSDLEGDAGLQPGFLDADDRRWVPHLGDAVPQLRCAGPEAARVPLEDLEINDGGCRRWWLTWRSRRLVVWRQRRKCPRPRRRPCPAGS